MRRWGSGAVAMLVGIGLLGCSTATVGTDWDRSVDFSQYSTFDFMPSQEIRNRLMRERVENAIEDQLRAKGLTRAAARPDLLVAIHAKLSTETHFDTTGYGYGWGRWGGYWGRWGYGVGTATTVAHKVPVGTLIIDLVDASRKELVWQAVTSDTLDPRASADERDRRVTKTMEKVFAGFPPGTS